MKLAAALRTTARVIARTLMIILLIVIIVPFLLYIPFVQDFAKDVAIEQVYRSTGMRIDLERVRLRWPLRVSLEGLSVTEPDATYPMVQAASAAVDVKVMPLLRGNIEACGLDLQQVRYQMGTADSLMYLVAQIERADVNDGSFGLKSGDVDVDCMNVDGVKVRLVMRPDTVPADTTPPSANTMRIRARRINMTRVSYTMRMLPTIDSLSADIDRATLTDGLVDLGRSYIHVRSLAVDSVSAAYFYPSPAYLAAHPELNVAAPADTTLTASVPWLIEADTLSLTGRRAVYGKSGARPQPGFDMNRIEVSDIDIRIRQFMNRGTSIRVPVEMIRATERCGLALSASGTFEMDSVAMRADDFLIRANSSELAVSHALMGMGDMTADPDLPLAIEATARIRPADVALAFPSMRAMLMPLDRRGALTLAADASGTPSHIDIRRLQLNAAGVVKLLATGAVDYPMDPDRLGGRMNLDGSISDGSLIAKILPAGSLPAGLHIPAMALKGDVDYRPGPAVTGSLTATTRSGRVALDGSWVARAESYDADLRLHNFPVDAFMPEYGIGSVTASLTARGRGYNPLDPSTRISADLDVASIEYKGEQIHDITVTATKQGPDATAAVRSSYPLADLDLNLAARVLRDSCTWDLDGSIRHLDLQALKLMTDTCSGSVNISSTGTYKMRGGYVDATASIDRLDWLLPGMHLIADDVDATVSTSAKAVAADASTGDFSLRFRSDTPLDSLMARISALPAFADSVIARRSLDVVALQHALPPLRAYIDLGSDNLVSRTLAQNGVDVGSAFLTLSNDSLIRLTGNARTLHFGSTAIDSIDMSAYQRGPNLVYDIMMSNAPGTMDDFAHVRLNGFVSGNRLSAFARQSNLQGREGFNIGLIATMLDSVATVKFVPRKPTIAYRRYRINDDNFVSYNLMTRKVKADLELTDSLTSVRLYTPLDSAGNPSSLSAAIRNLQLSDYLVVNPFAPPISGSLSANIDVNYDGQGLTGKGDISLANLMYDRQRVGDIDANVDVLTDPRTGFMRADAALKIDGRPSMTLSGLLNDSTATDPVQLDLRVINLPLAVANPFIGKDVAQLQGALKGRMNVTGHGTDMLLNGDLMFDSAAVRIPMAGTLIHLPSENIPVTNSVVSFDDFGLTALNENPLYINGTVDISNFANPAVKLNLYGHDMLLVDSDKPRGADVYGRGYLDFNANVEGNMDFMRVNAMVDLLSGSNVTYVLSASQSAQLSQGSSNDMVHFVQFSDTTAVAAADSLRTGGMAMLLDAEVIISQGSTVNVDLSTDGKNKVQIQSQGQLNYTMSPVMPDGRLTGRITIDDGFVRYTPPLMSEKLFNFRQGSYVAFTGDILNPSLSVYATDEIKANVTRSGENSRLVNFDVSVSVTGSLDRMNVAFDLSTTDDITVQNELQSMSPDQRANQAMNLLLYGVYNSNGTNGNANIGGNILYSFVESTLNNWMANNIKGVDISFGIDQYNQTYNGSTSTATNYSYHVSKTLFNDRFKIIVGGSYSTAAGADEDVAESLFNDISAEYMLNRSGSMYIKIFRHTGYESILEGEITQTGVGFVYRRRLQSLRDMFRFKKKSAQTYDPTSQQ